MLLTILVLLIVFCLVWYLIGIIPLPAPLANLKWVFYAILIVLAIVVLLNLTGVSLGL